jgi:hypothetical protein
MKPSNFVNLKCLVKKGKYIVKEYCKCKTSTKSYLKYSRLVALLFNKNANLYPI